MGAKKILAVRDTLLRRTFPISLKAAIAFVRSEMEEGIAPFKSVSLLNDCLRIRATRDSSPDPEVQLRRAWSFGAAAESSGDPNGMFYWSKKYENLLRQHRDAIRTAASPFPRAATRRGSKRG